MQTIQPIDARLLKASPRDTNAVFDSTLKITCVYALNEGPDRHDRDDATMLVGKEMIRRIKQTMPSAEIAVFPNREGILTASDPDYPGDPMIPVIQSVKDCDVLLFKTSTSEMGTLTPSQTFFDRFYALMKKFDGRSMQLSEKKRLAAVTVIGGCGAYELAGELLCRFSNLGFMLPSHASVVYEDGSDTRAGGTSTVTSSRAVQEQIDLTVNGVLRAAKMLKG